MKINFTEIKNTTERKKINKLYVKSVPAHEKSFVYFFWLKKKRKNVSFVNVTMKINGLDSYSLEP